MASPEAAYRITAAAAPICYEYGVVETVREIASEPKGDIGGLIANQIGRGSGRDIATMLDAAGNAYAGNYKTTTGEPSTVNATCLAKR